LVSDVEPEDMTLVTLTKFDGGIEIKSESLSVDSARLTDTERVVTDYNDVQQKVFQLTKYAIVTAAGSFHIKSLETLEMVARAHLMSGNDNFDKSLEAVKLFTPVIAASIDAQGELAVAGYDPEQGVFRIHAITFQGMDIIGEQEYEHYHVLGGKNLVELILEKWGDAVGRIGVNATDRSERYINTVTDNIMRQASEDEEWLTSLYPAYSIAFGGKVRRWVITEEGAVEHEAGFSLPVRVVPGKVYSDNYKVFTREVYEKFLADHREEIARKIRRS